MAESPPRVVIACSPAVRESYLSSAALERLGALAEWELFEADFRGGDAAAEDKRQLEERLASGVQGLVVTPGVPRVDAGLLDAASGLRIVGDIDGDRFASRIDVEAAWERGIRTVDTTNGSSYPVSEWALALILISLRNAGQHFRRIIHRQDRPALATDRGYLDGELTGKRVGLIGCGHIGRRLIQLLRPFDAEVWVHDPYLTAEMADAVGFLKTSLDAILTGCDVVVCLAPHTPATEGMIGQRELDLIPDGGVFVNVSRGVIVDSAALVARLRRGGLVAGLDVFDPEPFGGHEIVDLESVFLSPHIAGVVAASYTRMFDLMVDELERFFGGHDTLFDLTPRSLANRRGSEPPARSGA